MQGCSFTFRDVVRRLQEAASAHEAFVINPVVGPEAVSGSSRMKGGSATKILLEVVMRAAHDAASARRPVTPQAIREHVDTYSKCLDTTYSQTEFIADIMKSAGESLQCGRRVCYLGWGSPGVLGLIDASECVPTFGADHNDIRGFVSGGYGALDNKEGPLTSLGSNYCISHEDFAQTILPSLNDRDTVILIYTCMDDQSEVSKMATKVREKGCKLHSIVHGNEGQAAMEEQWELTTKLTLNAISTGAHVLKGKIYQNYMIDLQVTNSKLYHRATRLLQKFSGLPESQCQEALLKAVYEVEELSGIALWDIRSHTKLAAKRAKVVPLALVSLLTGCSMAEAQSSLDRQPVVRDTVTACLAQKN